VLSFLLHSQSRENLGFGAFFFVAFIKQRNLGFSAFLFVAFTKLRKLVFCY
jgi:hypothetical protein